MPEPTPRPADVPDELVARMLDAALDVCVDMDSWAARRLLAAVPLVHERQDRERVAAEIEAEPRDPGSEYERGLNIAAQLARGEGMSDATAPDAALRDQIADALTREHYRRAHERIEASPEDHCAAFADAVMPVVAAALTAARDEAAARFAATGSSWQQRAEKATAAVQRVRDLADNAEMTADVIDPTGERIQYAVVAVRDLRAALDRPADPPAETTEPQHAGGGNAEDCPVCRPLIDQPGGVLYPWHCTAADRPADPPAKETRHTDSTD